MRLLFCLLPLLSLLTAIPSRAQSLTVTSPERVLAVTVDVEDGEVRYSVARLGRPIVLPSRLGVVLADGRLDQDLTLTDSTRASFDETWTQPWGEVKEIRNRYNELALHLETTSPPLRQMIIRFRVYDDGVGFRYEWPEQANLTSFEMMDEVTEFVLADDPDAWWIPAYWPNRYEYLYRNTPASEIDTVHTPVTFETRDGYFISLHEAALVDYSSMTLALASADDRGVTLRADLVPWSDGVRVRAEVPHQSPWRTIQIGDTAGDLITSYLILNLNEPNRLGDVSWARPGKYVGVWWEIHIGRSSWDLTPKHGANTENVKRYIDFAAEHGFDHVLVEGWNEGWARNWIEGGDAFNFTQPYPDFDIEELSRYAADRGVRIMGHHETSAAVINYEEQMEDAYAWAAGYGIRSIKTGYVTHGQNIIRRDDQGNEHREWHHGQHMVNHYHATVLAAAEHQLTLNIHEPIKDTGLRRTYPNLMTREGARGQEYNAWGEAGGNPPDHTVILPFTRMLSGPFDYTPVIFGIDIPEQPDNRVNSTLAQQLAHMVVLYSPLQMAADTPDNYERFPDAFQFVRDVPADWHETRVLHGRIGDYITVVRRERDGTDWYLGSITDEYGRVLTTPLSFLDPGTTYVAQIYRDAAEADWETDPFAYEIEHVLVDASTHFRIRLAPGGGLAVRFRPATQEEVSRMPRYE